MSSLMKSAALTASTAVKHSAPKVLLHTRHTLRLCHDTKLAFPCKSAMKITYAPCEPTDGRLAKLKSQKTKSVILLPDMGKQC